MLHALPETRSFLFSFYNCSYAEFFHDLAQVEEDMKHDRYLEVTLTSRFLYNDFISNHCFMCLAPLPLLCTRNANSSIQPTIAIIQESYVDLHG